MSVEKREQGSSKLATALSEAQSIVEAAEQRARELLSQAERRFQDARDEGYREGFEEGRRDAALQAIRLIEESTAVGDTLAEEAAKLAIAISASLISSHLQVDPATVVQLAKNAIQEAVVGETVTLLINSEDEATITEALPDLRRVAGGAAISIETVGSLTRGGCIVRTDFGEVDASIEMLLAGVAERLGVPQDGR